MGPMPDQDPTPIMDDKHEVNVDEAENANGLHGGHAVGNALLVGVDGHVRKIPVPSSDPNDPLNFLPWQKYGVVVCCCWFCKFRKVVYGDSLLISTVSHHVVIPVRWSGRYSQYLLWTLHATRTFRGTNRLLIDISISIHWHRYELYLCGLERRLTCWQEIFLSSR